MQALGEPTDPGPASRTSLPPLLFWSHSCFITPKPVGQQLPHCLVPQVYVLKRPHVDEFLQRMGELFECVLFTASLAKVSPRLGSGAALLSRRLPSTYSQMQPWATLTPHSGVCLTPPQYADPVADLLDKWGAFRARLFRESCVFHRGNYVKDLSRLGRDLRRVLILDNSPASYVFHPDNAVRICGTQA